MRVGALRAIDTKDVDLEERVIRLRHRPEQEYPDVKGTPLKNGKDGERDLNISRELAELIDRYLNNPNRPDLTDKFGRKPLLTTNDGRPGISTIRRDLYKLTRPCVYSDECPHGRDIAKCDATANHNASECLSSHSPHPLRRWSIEHQIERGVPKELLTDRVDVSVPVLNKHYDQRSKERKRQHRLKLLEKVFDGYGDSDATIDQGVLADMLMAEDGTVDNQALMKLIKESKSEQDTETSEEKSKNQMKLGQFADGSTGVLHPSAVPIFCGALFTQALKDRLRRECESLTAKPGTSLHPSKGRVAKGVAAYALFVGTVAFHFSALGLTLGAIL